MMQSEFRAIKDMVFRLKGTQVTQSSAEVNTLVEGILGRFAQI